MGGELYDDAVAIMAERQLHARQASSLPPLANPTAWLVKAADSIRHEHANTIEHLDLSRYTAESLADRLERGVPRLTRPTAPGWHESKPYCVACAGNGWVFIPPVNGYEYVERCPTCCGRAATPPEGEAVTL